MRFSDIAQQYASWMLFFIVMIIMMLLITHSTFSLGLSAKRAANAQLKELIDPTIFTCHECRKTFKDPRLVSDIPEKPPGSLTYCDACYKDELRKRMEIDYLKQKNIAPSKIIEDGHKNQSEIMKSIIDRTNIQLREQTDWERKAELSRIGLSKKELKRYSEMENTLKKLKTKYKVSEV